MGAFSMISSGTLSGPIATCVDKLRVWYISDDDKHLLGPNLARRAVDLRAVNLTALRTKF